MICDQNTVPQRAQHAKAHAACHQQRASQDCLSLRNESMITAFEPWTAGQNGGSRTHLDAKDRDSRVNRSGRAHRDAEFRRHVEKNHHHHLPFPLLAACFVSSVISHANSFTFGQAGAYYSSTVQKNDSKLKRQRSTYVAFRRLAISNLLTNYLLASIERGTSADCTSQFNHCIPAETFGLG